MYDAANLKKLKVLKELAPEPMAAFQAFDAAVFKDGAISAKVKELIAVAHPDHREELEKSAYTHLRA